MGICGSGFRLILSLTLALVVAQPSGAASTKHMLSVSSEYWTEGSVGAIGMAWRSILPAPSFLKPEVRISSAMFIDWSSGWDFMYAMNSAYLLLMLRPPREPRTTPYIGFGIGAHLLVYDAPGHRNPNMQTSPSTPPMPPGGCIKVHRDRTVFGGKFHILGGLDLRPSRRVVINSELRFGIPRDPRFEVVTVGVGLTVGR